MPYDFYQTDKRIEFFKQAIKENPTPVYLRKMNEQFGSPGTTPKAILLAEQGKPLITPPEVKNENTENKGKG